MPKEKQLTDAILAHSGRTLAEYVAEHEFRDYVEQRYRGAMRFNDPRHIYTHAKAVLLALDGGGTTAEQDLELDGGEAGRLPDGRRVIVWTVNLNAVLRLTTPNEDLSLEHDAAKRRWYLQLRSTTLAHGLPPARRRVWDPQQPLTRQEYAPGMAGVDPQGLVVWLKTRS